MNTTDEKADDCPGESPTRQRGGWQGNDAGLRNLRRGREPSATERAAAPAEVPEEEGLSDLHKAMLHVFKYRGASDTTPLQREVRRWLKQDRRGFFRILADLDRLWARRESARRDGQEPRKRDRLREALGAYEPEEQDTGEDLSGGNDDASQLLDD
jgi:hypothetical protein